MVFLSVFSYKCHCKQILFNNFVILKPIFSLLFFEHGYLDEYLSYRYEIFNKGKKIHMQ